jgi:hypothetical protein
MTGAFEYLQWAVVWCRDIGLAVVSRIPARKLGNKGLVELGGGS